MVNKNNSKKMLIIFSISIIILLVSLILIYFFNNTKADSNNIVEYNNSQEEKTQVKGIVIDENNNPIENVNIDINVYSQNNLLDNFSVQKTNKDGSFVLENIPENIYNLTFYREGEAFVHQINLKENKKIDLKKIKLEKIGNLSGELIDEHSNTPLKNKIVKITITKWNNIELIVKTDENGKYAFPYLPDGEYKVYVCIDECKELEKNIPVEQGKSSSQKVNYNSSLGSINSTNSLPSSNSESTNNEDNTNNNNDSDSNNDDNNNDDPTSVISETKTLGGATVTIYRLNNSSTYPGILLLNGLSGESLARYGYYVVSHEPANTESACEIINDMKNQTQCSNSIGVTGSSWGGAMSLVIGSQCSVSAIASMYGVLVPENGINLAAGDIPHPTLFLTGENDSLATPTDVENMYNQFISSGYPGQLYIIPGAGHAYTGSEVYSKILNFFASYLN